MGLAQTESPAPKTPSPKGKAVDLFRAAGQAVIADNRELKNAIASNDRVQELENKATLRAMLVAQSLNIDTVYGYNFEYHHALVDPAQSQILHPYLNSGATAFGGSIATLVHGRIKLPRTQTEADREGASWLIFGDGKGLYCIRFSDLVKDDNPWGIAKDAKIENINAKLKELGVERYGWANDAKKNKLTPHPYFTYFDAVITSLFSLPFYLLPVPYNHFGMVFTIGLFFLRLHTQLEVINNQKCKNGNVPLIQEADILWHDGYTIGVQTSVASLLTIFMMNSAVQQSIGMNIGAALASAISSTLPIWSGLAVAVISGLVLGASLVAMAQASRNQNNPYTPVQLGAVFLAGFVAGALMYPLMLAATAMPDPWISSLSFQYLLNLGLGAALHYNVRDRLHVSTTKPMVLSHAAKIAPGGKEPTVANNNNNNNNNNKIT